MYRETPVETIPYRGYEIEVYPDPDPQSPREWDNLGTMTCWHRRYDLGDQHGFRTPGEWLDWAKGAGLAAQLPLYLLDHSGLRINVAGFDSCDPQRWDWGGVGWIYVTKERVCQEYSKQRVSKKTLARAFRVLRAEVETYDQYLSGAVYGYVAKTKFGDEIDSCWGFYGYDFKASGLLEMAENAIDHTLARRC